MPAPVVEVVGTDRLRATMRAAGRKLSDLTAVNKRTAAKVATTARPATPHRTGRLAASTRPGGTAKAALIRAGGATVVYAGVIHFGWAAHHIAPQPWLMTAATDTEPEWMNYYNAEIDKILSEIHGAS
jgi:hypothetical protein